MAKGATANNQAGSTPQSTQQPREKPELILRGSRRNQHSPNGYETTVLLFKAREAEYLTGFVLVKGTKHQVCVHMNERRPDLATGEIKPNFLVVSELDPDSNEWKELGHGNALNRRGDGKKVYFDEVLFSVNGEVLSARATAAVDHQLHRKLGFENPREARPKQTGTKDEPADEPAPAPARARSRTAPRR